MRPRGSAHMQATTSNWKNSRMRMLNKRCTLRSIRQIHSSSTNFQLPTKHGRRSLCLRLRLASSSSAIRCSSSSCCFAIFSVSSLFRPFVISPLLCTLSAAVPRSCLPIIFLPPTAHLAPPLKCLRLFPLVLSSSHLL